MFYFYYIYAMWFLCILLIIGWLKNNKIEIKKMEIREIKKKSISDGIKTVTDLWRIVSVTIFITN